jgi:hypothetical protein
MDKMCSGHTKEEAQICTTTWMNLENIREK